MRRVGRTAGALALAAMAGAIPAWAGQGAKGPGPVVIDLGPVVPTPEPTPLPERRLRLVSSITVHNKPDGETLFAFEVTDVARSERDEFRVLAAKQYSLLETKRTGRGDGESSEETPEVRALKRSILQKVRELEQELLKLAEELGPPEPPAPVSSRNAPAGRRY